ncbi:pyridoxamine 5'-phosphate oxidase family protein [Melghirimyces algeriensis]|uniref:Pyridoxamine 5'-phosphate oxidase N-terminal domain-containing protein n=1 Tax=Melghirimyces algeriensis TaxID=910412 RepID=A0A521AV99_9BACL|nr:pyridoxamine 5'-phosphate oxidase family protein [Melghirimyces algeriensis]SMO38739.1 hypothetical protein SAMN06264849_101368 [Melghirimyces algeriensis]
MCNRPFQDVITTEEELCERMGTPNRMVARKAIDHLDQHCRDFIALSPFVLLATTDALGACDVSPRGDAPGFVQVLDDNHLVIPERPGNRRMDSLRNILSIPQVGLLFLIPGLGETLRVNGRACVIKDQKLLQPMAVNGRSPKVGIGLEVKESFIHCAKSLKRSRLWEPETWLEPSALPHVSKMLADHIQLPDVTAESVEKRLKESYTHRLY